MRSISPKGHCIGWRVRLAMALALLLVSEALADVSAARDAAQVDVLRTAIASPASLQGILAAITRLSPSRQSALDDRAGTLARLYVRRHFAPLWTQSKQPTAQAAAALQLLCDAGDYGLVPRDYSCDSLTRELWSLRQRELGAVDAPYCAVASGTRSGSPLPAWTCFELQLSGALMVFLSDVHAGRISPHQVGFELPARPTLDLTATLVQLATAVDPRAVVSTVEPPYIHYRLLKDALQRYRALAQRPALSALPPLPRPKLALGDRYQGAPELRTLLNAIGCLDRTAAPDPFLIDAPLVDALKRFQWLHGLLVDGVLGRRTYRELTVPLHQRVRQIELTLERWRWLPPLRQRTILVNIPQFRLFAFDSQQDRELGMLRMDVIVGREYAHTQTPVFTADLTTVVFRPYWDVPRSIVLREVLPQVTRDAHYLETQHLELVRGETDASPVVPATPENLLALAKGTLRLRQRSGPDNALGLVKFLLPNDHDVYLHDTPALQLFRRAQRTFSHGCIRVADPVALARYALADNEGDWTDAKITAAMQGNATMRVPLSRPVHVMILYGTAIASEDGAVHFFHDIYGQDRRLQSLLELPPLPEAHAAGVDVHEVRSRVEPHPAAPD